MKKAASGFIEMLLYLREDIDRYVVLSQAPGWICILTCPGIWVTAQYRFSRWVKYYFHVPVVRKLLRFLCAISQKIIVLLVNCELPNDAAVGKGLLLNHPYGIVIHTEAQIGDYCNISQDTTIGIGGRKEESGVPKLGNGVFVGPGARIFGKLSIGDNVAVGANAVVTKNLPANAVAVGIPAKVISYEGAQDFILLR